MNIDKQRFIDALTHFVAEALRRADEGGDYIRGSVEVLDARNELFRFSSLHTTDEELNRYALRELCKIDDESMQTIPDRGHIERVARNYFD